MRSLAARFFKHGLVGAILIGRLLSATAAPGTVYLVVGSDTAIWDGLDVGRHYCHYRFDLYTAPQGNAYKVLDPVFRHQFVDSFGQPMKLTWWMMTGNVFRYADNTDVPFPNIMTLYLIKKYHRAAIEQCGDQLAWHYHTFIWSDYNGDGLSYWNEAHTFQECREDFDYTLAQMLLEEGLFPASFRSGWHYMDNEWQQYLNNLIPFSLHNYFPNIRASALEPIYNVYDWSQAPSAFVPFQPSLANYQLPGVGAGWNVRSVKMQAMTQTLMDQMFQQAAQGMDQVACLWAHLPESDFPSNLALMDFMAHQAATNYPNVQFRYCTAVEAMQRWMGTEDHTAPRLDVSQAVLGQTVTLTLQVNEPIFQPQPFVVVKDLAGQYQLPVCQPTGENTWTVSLPVDRSLLAKVGIAVTDLAGNVTTRFLFYSAPRMVLQLLATSPTGGPVLSLDGEPGFQYIIQNSTNFIDWTPILTNAAPLAFVDRNVTNWPARFYRAIGQPAQ